MSGKKILLKVLAAALVLLVGAVAAALTLDFDSPELGRAILARAGQAAGLDVKAEGFRLNLLRGLRLENVEITSLLAPGGSRFDARADRLVLEHRVLPLLKGEVVVEQIVLERPTVALVAAHEVSERPAEPKAAPEKKPAGEPAPAEPEAGGAGLTLAVRRFAIVDGSLVIHEAEGGEAAPPTEIHGLDLELREIATDSAAPTLVQGLTAQGEISADRVVAPGAGAENARGDVRLGGGHLVIANFQLPTIQGRLVVGQLDADLTVDPYTYTLNLSGDPLNTNVILGAGEDAGMGPARLALDLSGDGSDDGNVAGAGVFTLEAGTLPGLPALAALERLVAGTKIVGEAYEPLEVRFTIGNNRLEIEPCELRSGEIAVRLAGTVGFDGSLGLRTALSAPREGVGALEIPKEVVELLTDAEGRVNLPILIGGTQEDPKVDFDRSGWKEMAKKRVEEELKKEMGKALGKLFGKKKDGP